MTGKRKIIFLFLLLCVIIFLWKTYQYWTLPSKQDEIAEGYVKETLVDNKIKVSIYYEALCSDSRNFFIKQLEPMYGDFHNYLELDFIPYGKAKTMEKDGVITFKCQHAAVECVANKIHACSLLYVKNQELQLKYITCMIKDNMIPHESGEKCAKQLGIQYDPISECAHAEQSSLLLKKYGERTQAVKPAITFIPTIELNDQQNVPLVHILKNFKKVICDMLHMKSKPCL
ncbi:hypothetical protein RI129_011848 [Pyrocoelia pectoralis]|uniref:Uncharacterized protein n=1 Tax=Pyrocoelia pectoralis TaxID=417401 RepID=A0AAN7V5L2_9COLE